MGFDECFICLTGFPTTKEGLCGLLQGCLGLGQPVLFRLSAVYIYLH